MAWILLAILFVEKFCLCITIYTHIWLNAYLGKTLCRKFKCICHTQYIFCHMIDCIETKIVGLLCEVSNITIIRWCWLGWNLSLPSTITLLLYDRMSPDKDRFYVCSGHSVYFGMNLSYHWRHQRLTCARTATHGKSRRQKMCILSVVCASLPNRTQSIWVTDFA